MWERPRDKDNLLEIVLQWWDKSGVTDTKAHNFEILNILGNMIDLFSQIMSVDCVVAFGLSTTINLFSITFVTCLTLQVTKCLDYRFLTIFILVITFLKNHSMSKE